MAIILEKNGDQHRINLEKTPNISKEMVINLDWSKGGFFKNLLVEPSIWI